MFGGSSVRIVNTIVYSGLSAGKLSIGTINYAYRILLKQTFWREFKSHFLVAIRLRSIKMGDHRGERVPPQSCCFAAAISTC